MPSKQRDRGPPAGAVRRYGKPAGLPAGFRFAKRACGPPFGSTGNAPAGRPLGPHPFHTCGLCLENRFALFHTAPYQKISISSIY